MIFCTLANAARWSSRPLLALPPPAKTDVWVKRMNLTTTTSKDFLELYGKDHKDSFKLHDGYFHPFDGPLAQNGLAVPIGYVLWFFNVVPSSFYAGPRASEEDAIAYFKKIRQSMDLHDDTYEIVRITVGTCEPDMEDEHVIDDEA